MAATPPLHTAMRATFTQFIAAQNARDARALHGLLLDDPAFLWVTRTAVSIHGHEAAMDHIRQSWRDAWKLEPTWPEITVTTLAPGAGLLHCPLRLIPAPEAAEAPIPLKWTGAFRQTALGLRLAAILVAAAPAAPSA